MFADPHAEVLMERAEDNRVRRALFRRRCRICAAASERRNDVHPPQEAEHLNETGKDTEGHRHRDDVIEPEHLPQQHRPGDQEQPRQHERPPQQDQPRTALAEPLEDL